MLINMIMPFRGPIKKNNHKIQPVKLQRNPISWKYTKIKNDKLLIMLT